MCEEKRRPSFRAILSNWNENDATFMEKVVMAIKNNWIKIRNGQSCCGNHGEVGC